MSLSERVVNIKESQSVKLAEIIAKLQSSGQSTIGLHVGEPSFSTPEIVIKATEEALRDNQTRYSYVPGLPELRELIVQKMKRDHHISCDINNVLVSNGSKQILYNIFQTILNPGDEVLIPCPYWVSFPEGIKLAGGRPVFVESFEDHQPSLENLESHVTKKTKAIIINTPNNPSGAIYDREVLKKIGDLAIRHDLIIISDEAYETLVYDEQRHISMASLSDEIKERTITVQSFSKSFSMTGFRLGYMVAPFQFIQGVNKLQGHLTGNNCTFAQYGAIAALQSFHDIVPPMLKEMQKRRDLAYDKASKVFNFPKPQGAFYLFPKINQYYNQDIKSDIDLAEVILKNTGVGVLPGSFFGSPHHIRVAFSGPEENVIEGLSRIGEYLCK